MIHYSFDFPYQIDRATKVERCENFGCHNIIKEGDIFYLVPTQLIVNKKVVWQKLCSKCVQVYFKGLLGDLKKKVLSVKLDLGNAEMVAERNGEGF
jgi:hypothetical protein